MAVAMSHISELYKLIEVKRVVNDAQKLEWYAKTLQKQQ